MRTVLVTGGAGFIGSHLVDQLLADGAVVRVLDNLSTGSFGNLQAAAERHARGGGAVRGSRLEVVVGDIRDRELLRKALRSVKYVFHLAAIPPSAAAGINSGEIHAVNVEGTLNVLQGALTEGVWRVVVASCGSVYGTPKVLPVPEDAPVGPTSLFAASKAAAETYSRAFCARHQLDTVNLRYFNIYGPRQKPGGYGTNVPQLVEAVRQRHAVVGHDGRSTDDFLYVDDAIAATLAAARAPRAAGRAINIGSGRAVAVSEVANIVARLLQISSVPEFLQVDELRPQYTWADTALATQLLEFSPRTSLVAGLASVVRSVTQVNRVEDPALASAGFDD